jgi:NADH-quinone oxidoreductase subunit K
MAVAAAEAAVGLAIIIALFRNKQTMNVDDLNIMKW